MNKFLVLTAMLFSTATFAASGESYFGGGYQIGNYDETDSPSLKPKALKLEYGKYLTNVVSLEGHLALGIKDDSITVFEPLSGTKFDIDIGLEHMISGFVKGDLKLNENLNLYGLIGITQAKLEASSRVFGFEISKSTSETSLSYGAGIEGSLANGLILSGEYIMYVMNGEGYKYSGINLGITKKF